MKFTTVSVIGLGYIGLPTAALLATKGYRVAGCDINQRTVDSINRGIVPIVENDLDLFQIADNKEEVMQILEKFHNNYNFSPNF